MQILPLTGQGSGATATAARTSNAVSSLTITAAGSNYINPPNVVFTGGAGTGAAATAIITNGAVTGFTITAGGSGYTSDPTVTLVVAPGGPTSVSVTGALAPTGGVDISGMTGGTITYCVEVQSLTAAKTLLVALELTVNAFGASILVGSQQFIGQIGPGGTAFVSNAFSQNQDKRSFIVRQQMPFAALNYFGVASAKARVNVTGIDASALATINAWLELG